jgi:serine/threonine protein kinase
MRLEPGVRLGSYEIVAPLGAGGMGEVYRARDTKLNREVAIKVLPESFVADPDRLSRFQREAHVLASLNHPNIASIYGFEDAEATHALVLELVEGTTLEERLREGPIAADEALPIARQIAEALEAAHARGIIHRDLKPANVKVRADGAAKVLDFGLAKALDTTVAGDLSGSPTRTSPAAVTHAGVVLGTAAYMAPEQAKGKAVDGRADIWAFGCVLYEMLSGQSPFGGESVGEMLASVLKTDPDWQLLPADTPEGVRRLLRRCLQKDPARRLQHVGDARIEIEEALAAPLHGTTPARSRSDARVAWSIAGVLAVTAAILGFLLARPAPTPEEVRLEIATPPTTDPISLAISPDARKLVYAATTTEGRTQLWLRQLDSTTARPLTGTDSASLPFWSPDSRSIGFFAEAKLKRLSLDSGAVHVLANAQAPAGGTWNRDDTILFAPNISGDIYRITATGGDLQPTKTRSDGRQLPYRFPQFLPDGRHFIYSVMSGSDSGIYVGNLDGSVTTRLLEADSPAVYGSGHLFFIRQGNLFAQRFDAGGFKLGGNPIRVAEQVPGDRFGAPLSAAIAGPIVYRAGLIPSRRQFVWVDRAGKELERVGEPDNANSFSPTISGDGRRVAVHRIVDGNPDIWLFDMGRRVLERFTTHPANDIHPVWSPDGTRIIYASLRDKVYDLYEGSLIRTDQHELLLATPESKRPTDWSADGRFLLYRVNHPKTGPDIWALSMTEGKKTFPVVQTEFEESGAQFSPKGKWIVYESNKSGRSEIVVQPFLRSGGDLRISLSGGSQARWAADGNEIHYVAPDGRLMAASMRLSSDGQTIEGGIPVPLFAAGVGPAVQRLSNPQYMVAPDGKRFLLNRLTGETSVSPITVILNWKPTP